MDNMINDVVNTNEYTYCRPETTALPLYIVRNVTFSWSPRPMGENHEQMKVNADATEYPDSKCGSGLSDRSVPWEPPKLPSSECSGSLIVLMLEKGAAVQVQQQVQSQHPKCMRRW
jgi:hypothetical protein